MNNSDIFGAYITGTKGQRAAAIMLPMYVAVTSTKSDPGVGVQNGWYETGGLLNGGAYLGSAVFATTASVWNFPGLTISLGIGQDFQGTTTVSYFNELPANANGGTTSCSNPEFLADYAIPPNFHVTTDASGTSAVWKDCPSVPINSVARYSISGIKDVGYARDFVVMQIGNGPLGFGPGQGQVVSEVDWNYVNTIAFTKPQVGANTRTKGGPPNLDPVVPNIGATKFGGPPTSTPVPNRNATANDFFTTSSNWKATTSMPPAFTTPIILPTQ